MHLEQLKTLFMEQQCDSGFEGVAIVDREGNTRKEAVAVGQLWPRYPNESGEGIGQAHNQAIQYLIDNPTVIGK